MAVAFLIPLAFGIWLDLGFWPIILPRQLLVNSSAYWLRLRVVQIVWYGMTIGASLMVDACLVGNERLK